MSKVVAITGAGSGIGAATAERMAAGGARVVLGGRREERLREVASRIEDAGGQVAWLPTDVRRPEDVQKLVDLAVERFGRLDVLVGSAGVAYLSSFEDHSPEQIENTIDVNLKGVLYGMSAALPIFRRQGSGHLVQIVSTSGLRIVPGQVVYAGAKNAVRTICEGLRQEVGDSVRITAISPGMIRTEFAGERPGPDNPEALATWEQVQKVAIEADAIARAVVYAVEQPAEVDVNEIVVRPTAQS